MIIQTKSSGISWTARIILQIMVQEGCLGKSFCKLKVGFMVLNSCGNLWNIAEHCGTLPKQELAYHLSDDDLEVRTDPFLDEHGILRVGGRLRRSLLDVNLKYPVLLPCDGFVTNLIIKFCHERVIMLDVA